MSPDCDFESDETAATTTVLRLRGVLDARSAPVLARRCAEIRGAGRHLALNLSGVTFIASSGVGALLALVEEFRHGSTRVRLAEVSTAVLSVVRLLNLEPFLSLCPTEVEAVAQLEALAEGRRRAA